jgi:hypothetical protein
MENGKWKMGNGKWEMGNGDGDGDEDGLCGISKVGEFRRLW